MMAMIVKLINVVTCNIHTQEVINFRITDG